MYSDDTVPLQKRAPALYGIAAFKIGKGLIFLLLALGVYSLSDDNLPDAFRSLVQWFHLDPERQLFAAMTAKIQKITESNMLWVAGGTLAYSLLALTEGIGLACRASWAGWLAIAESAVFVPIEIMELAKGFSWGLFGLLCLNIFICWYLFTRRARLFRHFHFEHHKSQDSV